MKPMTQACYDAVTAEAGEWLDESIRHPFDLDDACRLRMVACVYIATNIWGQVVYVGSARRSRGVGTRIREHLRLGRKTGAWRHIWIVPLRPASSIEDVREVEGRIGMRLLPSGNVRLPQACWSRAALPL